MAAVVLLATLLPGTVHASAASAEQPRLPFELPEGAGTYVGELAFTGVLNFLVSGLWSLVSREWRGALEVLVRTPNPLDPGDRTLGARLLADLGGLFRAGQHLALALCVVGVLAYGVTLALAAMDGHQPRAIGALARDIAQLVLVVVLVVHAYELAHGAIGWSNLLAQAVDDTLCWSKPYPWPHQAPCDGEAGFGGAAGLAAMTLRVAAGLAASERPSPADLLVLLVLLVALVVILCTLFFAAIARVVYLGVLLALAPFALACLALPNPFRLLCWSYLLTAGKLLLIAPANVLMLGLASRVAYQLTR